MKGKNNQEETYFLGKAQETRYTKSHISKKVFGIAVCVIAIIGITIALIFKPQSVSHPHVLKTIAVLPEGGQMPVFNGNGDINDFLRWVMTNIQYPKGLEDKPARVVINFTVQKDGTLGLFKVLDSSAVCLPPPNPPLFGRSSGQCPSIRESVSSYRRSGEALGSYGLPVPSCRS